MAGHSKWKNIRRTKEKTDAQKAKIFTKITLEMIIAVKEGGADPINNSKLRDLIAKAKQNNMPNDNIERALKKASGDVNKENFEYIKYEGYAAEGVAVIVEALTDNKNRTASEVRHLFDKYSGNLGATGCVSYMFDRKAIIIIEKSDSLKEEDMFDLSIECDALEFIVEDDFYQIETSIKKFTETREFLEEKGIKLASAEIEYVPQNFVEVKNEDNLKKINTFLDLIEDNSDVINVWHNGKF